MIGNFVQRLNLFFEKVIPDLDMDLDRLRYMTAQEEHEITYKYNETDSSACGYVSFCGAFRNRVLQGPGRIALEQGAVQITFAELDRRSDTVAAYLQSRFPEKNNVCVLHGRTPDLLVFILGIMKAGHVYIPLNVEDPVERMQYILSDTGSTLLIADALCLEKKPEILSYCEVNGIEIFSRLPQVEWPPVTIQHLPQQSDIAYIIYTSGTTGKPKGVKITGENLMNYLSWAVKMYMPEEGGSMALHSNIAFDMSVTSMFVPLIAGGKVILYAEGAADFTVGSIIMENKTTVLKVTPSHLRLLTQLMDQSSFRSLGHLQLKTLIVGGENLTRETAQKVLELFDGNVDIYNEYGPTEVTVGCMIHLVDPARDKGVSIPIGKPINNTRVYILNEHMEPVPVGFPGELYIGGKGVASGYHNQDVLTSQRFLVSPFAEGERLYKTGDIAVMLPEMNILYLGRADEQVKVNGYRVEPEEIKRQITACEHVKDAEITFQVNEEGNGVLLCYYISDIQIDEVALRNYCLKTLPAYMVPAFFIRIAAIPLTASGKLNRSALPAYVPVLRTQIEMSGSEEEHRLLNLWKEILKRDDINIGSDFYQVGGDSIKAIRLVAALNRTIDVKLTVNDLFVNPTVRQLLRCMQEKKTDTLNASMEKIRAGIAQMADSFRENDPRRELVEDVFPVSDIQLGMIYHARNDNNVALYHDQMVHRLRYPDFDIDRFKQAMGLLVEVHSTLRTGFDLYTYSQPLQIVFKQVEWDILSEDLSTLSESDAKARISDFREEDRRQPFDITKAPLWRLHVFSLGRDEIVMVWVVHHAIIDGWSDASFKTELHNTYCMLATDSHYRLSPLKATYKDYVIAENASKNNADNKRFWEQELRGLQPSLLPSDPTSATGKDVTSVKFMLPEALGQAITGCSRKLDIDVRSLLFAACVSAMKMLTCQSEVTVGIVLNNRPETEDGDKVLGCFLNTLPVRYSISPQDTYREVVMQVANKLRNIQLYKHSTLREISELVDHDQEEKRPLFDTIFNYMDFHIYDAAAGLGDDYEEDLSLEDWSVTNYPLTFNVSKKGKTYEVELLHYNDFIRSMEQTICAAFKRTLEYIVTDIDREVRFEDLMEAHMRDFFTGVGEPGKMSQPETIHDLFEKQVEQTPDSVAVTCKERILSYRELNAKANHLAISLREHGVERDVIVALLIEGPIEMIISMLAVLKAGGAYLPLVHGYPDERNRNLLKKCRVKMGLADSDDSLHLMGTVAGMKCKDVRGVISENGPCDNLVGINTPADLVYVTAVSDSTGQPQAAMLEHRNLANVFYTLKQAGNISFASILQMNTLNFDVAPLEIFGALLHGGRLHLAGEEISTSASGLFRTIREQGITTLFLPASILHMLFNNSENEKSFPACISHIVCTGEQLVVGDVFRNYLIRNKVHLHNYYGQSTCQVVTVNTLPPYKEIQEQPAVGKPLQNNIIYILDTNGQLLPQNVPGELFISGVQVGRGYVHDEMLTSERFLPDPFRPGMRMYKTGDVGKWLADGNIRLLERTDGQVKIRGLTVELAEVESSLRQYAGVREVMVVADTENGITSLTGYYTADGMLDNGVLRAHMMNTLPDYMVPVGFVYLEKMPSMHSGRLNKRGGMPTFAVSRKKDFIAPKNDIEEILSGIWSDVLQLDSKKISVNDNFFHLGGNSLGVMLMADKIHWQLKSRISVAELFRKPTIQHIASFIKARTILAADSESGILI